MNKVVIALESAGYAVKLVERVKYRGSPERQSTRLEVVKDGTRWETKVGCKYLLQQIYAVQEAVPIAAQVHQLIETSAGEAVAIVEFIDGELLWETEIARPPLPIVERALEELLVQLDSVGLVHGDIRPWNLILTRDDVAVRVIDWGFTFFRDRLMSSQACNHLNARGHKGSLTAAIDRVDVGRTLRVLAHPHEAEECWKHRSSTFSWRPSPWGS